jgi:hypothetical protein
MSARNGTVLLLALSTLTLLVGCGSSNNTTVVTPPPSGSFSNSDLSGTYVFSVSGTDFAGAPYAIVGTFMANGSGGNGRGGITGGTIDINDVEFTPVFGVAINNSGYYSVGQDGRGQMTIGTPSGQNPFGENMTFDFVLSSSSHGLITEFDNNGTGSGTIDAQTAGLTQASLTGTYAFSFSGVDGNFNPLATVGNFNILDSSGDISGLEDFNDADLAYPNFSLSGSLTLGPQTTPSTVLSTGAFQGLTFDVYAIDATHLKFIESDDVEFLSGDAYSQTSTTIPSETLAFTLDGFFPFSGDSSIPAAAGGFMVADGAGGITNASTEDVNDGGTPSTAPVTFTADYTAQGAGRYVLSGFSGFFGGTEYVAYPYSNGLFLLELDDAGIMAGAAYTQSPTIPTFASAEGYGLSLTGDNLTNGVEVDDIAEFTAASGGTISSGIIDENADPNGSEFGAPFYGLPLTNGLYNGPDASGRYGLAVDAGNSNVTTLNGGLGLTFYAVDGTNFPFIETDNGGQVSTGVLVLQTPSSATPVVAKPRALFTRPLIRAHGDFKKRTQAAK